MLKFGTISIYFTMLSVLFLLMPGYVLASASTGADAATAFGLWSLFPAFLAIFAALITRHVLPSLFLGVWAGAWLIAGGDLHAVIDGFLRVIDTYLLRALVPEDGSTDHISIIIFTLLTGGMIGVISRNGGLAGIVEVLAKHADNAKKGQVAAALTGIMIFFDDYANTLIVGNTMRPLMDKLRVSREKLAFIVDTTAAPMASIALITTWIGFQVSLIESSTASIDGLDVPSYELMVASIPYSFYSILSILFIFLIIGTGRDFGAMYKAEYRARNSEHLTTKTNFSGNKEYHLAQATSAYNAAIPIATLIVIVIAGLLITGWQDGGVLADGSKMTISDILGNANPFTAMLWASLSGLIVAIIMTVWNTDLGFADALEAMEDGLSPMIGAILILTFAWAIAGVNDSLGTADYLTRTLGAGLDPRWLPAIIFVLASVIAFATGTSWGVMAILVPLAVPLTWSAMQSANMDSAEYMPILYATIASTLTGAVWGDHCSPISDTTILSSVASGCNHVAHVRTQLPYAMSVAAISLLVCLLPVGYGVPWWITILLAIVALYILLRVIGKEVSVKEEKNSC